MKYGSNREALESAFPKMPERFDYSVRKALEETRAMQKKRMRRGALLIAVLSLALAGSALAITQSAGIFNFFADMIGEETALVQKDAYSLVRSDIASHDFEHVTVSVREAVYDGEMLRVVLSIRDRAATTPFACTMDDIMNGTFHFPAAEQDGINWSIMDWLYIDGRSVCPEGEAGARAGAENGEILQYIQTYIDRSTLGDTFTVGFPLLKPGTPDGRYEKDASGELIDPTPKDLTFTLSATDLKGVTALPLPKTQDCGAYTATVVKALISPIRVYLNVRFDVKSGAAVTREEIERAWFGAVVTDAAGHPLLSEADSSIGVPYGDSENYGTTTLFGKYMTAESYPDEIYLAPVNEKGEPDMRLAIRLSTKEE